jgi:hypothetical protein
MSRLGTFRASYLVALCCVGSFLFAYDTGIVGGVLSLESFQRDMGMTPGSKSTVSSNSASLLQAGGEHLDIPQLPLGADRNQHFSPASSSGPLPHDTVDDGPLF